MAGGRRRGRHALLLAGAALAPQLLHYGLRGGSRQAYGAFAPGVGTSVREELPRARTERRAWGTGLEDLLEEGRLRAEVLTRPEDPSVHWNLGLLLAHRGERSAAEETLSNAFRAAGSMGVMITAYSIPEELGGLSGYKALLGAELEDFRGFCAASAAPALAAEPHLREALPAALEEFQRLPLDASWQVAWAAETARLFGPDPKSAAYGETLFSAVREVMSHPAVDAAVAAGADRVVLLGSALGYQCLYFLAAGLPCVGYDLLAESMVGTGRGVLERHGLTEAGLDFRVGDAREAPLGAGDGDRPSVVWMNDEVWPEELRSALLRRAAAELRPGSVLISYGSLGALPPGLRLAGDVRAKTSWDAAETISILQRVDEGALGQRAVAGWEQLQGLR